MLLQRLHHLRGQPLLHLGATRINLKHPRQFAQPRHLAVSPGNVPNMRHPVERHQVMLARGIERDILHQHHLGMGNIEGRAQHIGRVSVQTREKLLVGASHSRRGVL